MRCTDLPACRLRPAALPLHRSLPRWQVQELTPGHTIRQGAYKMQLREREEAELELVRGPSAAASSTQRTRGPRSGGRGPRRCPALPVPHLFAVPGLPACRRPARFGQRLRCAPPRA